MGIFHFTTLGEHIFHKVAPRKYESISRVGRPKRHFFVTGWGFRIRHRDYVSATVDVEEHRHVLKNHFSNALYYRICWLENF